MTDCLPHPFEDVAPLGGSLRLTGLLARTHDRFIYQAEYLGAAVLAHEYVPAGLVQREGDGRITPIRDDLRTAYIEARDAFTTLARQWQTLTDGNSSHLARVRAVKPGLGEYSAWVITDPYTVFLTDVGLPVPEAATALANALSDVSGPGLTLGNIAPETVFWHEGRVVFAGPSPDARNLLTHLADETVIARLGYAAPELYDGRKRASVGPESDLFAATALILRLVSGRDPPDVTTGGVPAEVEGVLASGTVPPTVAEALRLGLAVLRKQRLENLKNWFETLSPPSVAPQVSQAAPAAVAPALSTPPPPAAATPAAAKPAIPPVAAKPAAGKSPLWIWGSAAAVLIAVVITGTVLKPVLAERQKAEAADAVTACESGMASGKPAQAMRLCSDALKKNPERGSAGHDTAAYTLGLLCETRSTCPAGKSARDYYRLAADNTATVTGKLASYRLARVTSGLSLVEQHDLYAPAAGVLRKVDKAFVKSNRDTYRQANYQIGLVFDKWSKKDDFTPEELQRLSTGSSSSPQKIAMISAINRLEVARSYKVDVDARLLDLYERRGDDDRDTGQFETALKSYRKSAALGSATSAYKIADLFFTGEATSGGRVEALDQLDAAGQKSDVDALHCLTAIYYYGYPFGQNREKADGYLAKLKSLQTPEFDMQKYNGLSCSGWISRGMAQG